MYLSIGKVGQWDYTYTCAPYVESEYTYLNLYLNLQLNQRDAYKYQF